MLLNFDKLIGEPKAIIWEGKEYCVNEVTVDLYLRVIAAQSSEDSMSGMIAVAEALIPGFKAANFPVRFLNRLIEYITAQGGEEGKNGGQSVLANS